MVESVFLGGRKLRTSHFKENSSVYSQEAKLMVARLVLFVASRPVGQDPVATMSKVALSRREPKQKNKARYLPATITCRRHCSSPYTTVERHEGEELRRHWQDLHHAARPSHHHLALGSCSSSGCGRRFRRCCCRRCRCRCCCCCCCCC